MKLALLVVSVVLIWRKGNYRAAAAVFAVMTGIAWGEGRPEIAVEDGLVALALWHVEFVAREVHRGFASFGRLRHLTIDWSGFGCTRGAFTTYKLITGGVPVLNVNTLYQFTGSEFVPVTWSEWAAFTPHPWLVVRQPIAGRAFQEFRGIPMPLFQLPPLPRLFTDDE